MKILLTNDDGIFADGIRILAEILSEHHAVTVVAPDGECSGTSHSLSIFSKLTYKKCEYSRGIEAYSVKGTPSDCVKFATKVLLDAAPDLVISGINNLPNLGTDVIYSGTVNAALEGAICGIRSIALSVLFERGGDYEYVSHFVLKNLEKLYSILRPETAFNINFPSGDPTKLSGMRFSSLGVRLFDDEYIVREHGEELHYFLTGEPIKTPENPEDCDVELHEEQYVTITPLHIQMTDFTALKRLREYPNGVEL
ncbi:MAG: 5'/3'-nucleotidase SurE [Clostridiales bacterium]|jgi:5'-nucleotidase|nr:5'/3'-nucleotidase SurE [Clostridiales bacterium]